MKATKRKWVREQGSQCAKHINYRQSNKKHSVSAVLNFGGRGGKVVTETKCREFSSENVLHLLARNTSSTRAIKSQYAKAYTASPKKNVQQNAVRIFGGRGESWTRVHSLQPYLST